MPPCMFLKESLMKPKVRFSLPMPARERPLQQKRNHSLLETTHANEVKARYDAAAAPIVTSAGSVLTIFSIFRSPTRSNTSLIISEGLPSFLTSFRSFGLMEFAACAESS